MITTTPTCDDYDCEVCYPPYPVTMREKIVAWWRSIFPLRRASTFAAMLDASLRDHRLRIEREDKRRQEEHERTMGSMEKAIYNCTFLTFRRDGRRYRVVVDFDPDIVSNAAVEREREMLAEVICRRLRREIVTARFVIEAEAHERIELMRDSGRIGRNSVALFRDDGSIPPMPESGSP